MRVATFNVLADAYIGYGDYSHVYPDLLAPRARTDGLVRTIASLDADVIGLQEADEVLVKALRASGEWQTCWSPKEGGKPDGCLTLVRDGIAVDGFETHAYQDGTGHIMQILHIGRVAFANSHIKWAPADSAEHVGVGQMTELLAKLNAEQVAVVFADSNDRPNGPVRRLVEDEGFTDVSGENPTALVNQQAVAIDLLAVRGLPAVLVPRDYDVLTIPNSECPSDHIPIVADLAV